MIYFLISILLGAIPDVLYYYLWLKNIKEINELKEELLQQKSDNKKGE